MHPILNHTFSSLVGFMTITSCKPVGSLLRSLTAHLFQDVRLLLSNVLPLSKPVNVFRSKHYRRQFIFVVPSEENFITFHSIVLSSPFLRITAEAYLHFCINTLYFKELSFVSSSTIFKTWILCSDLHVKHYLVRANPCSWVWN